MKDIKFESDAIISFQDIDFSSFGCGMKIEAKAVIAEVEGNNIRLIIVGHGQTAHPTTTDDPVNIFPVLYCSFFFSHFQSDLIGADDDLSGNYL